MARLDWKAVTPEHYFAAAQRVLQTIEATPAKRGRSTGPTLFVVFEGAELPAKEIVRVAYRLAHGLPEHERVVFSSGEATRSRLIAAGLDARRRPKVPADRPKG